jgi:hypothetical protein
LEPSVDTLDCELKGFPEITCTVELDEKDHATLVEEMTLLEEEDGLIGAIVLEV